jgi:hypothetical protein
LRADYLPEIILFCFRRRVHHFALEIPAARSAHGARAGESVIMPTQYADLDELVLRCRSESAREHIREAVLCYRAGAYRATIISTWVAVVYDFVDKFRELALDGDKQAEALVNKFEAIHKTDNVEQALEFERTLLQVCKDTFDLLTPQESVDLERLVKDRNRCAHPNLIRHGEIYMPTPELARAHLRNVVEHALERPPKVGKAAADQLFKEVQSEYFPTDPKQALEILKRGPLARPKDNLLREFVLGIASTALKGELTTQEVSKRFAAIKAVNDLHHEQFLKLIPTHFANLFRKTPDVGFKFLLPLLAQIPELQEAVDGGLEAKLIRCIEKCPSGDLTLVLTAALRIGVFHDAAAIRTQTLDEESLTSYLKSRRGIVPSEIIDRALELYSAASDFAEANRMGKNLLQSAIKSFNQPQAKKLFEIAEANNQVFGSRVFDSLLEAIREVNLLPPDQFDQEIERRKWSKYYRRLMYEPPPEQPDEQ